MTRDDLLWAAEIFEDMAKTGRPNVGGPDPGRFIEIHNQVAETLGLPRWGWYIHSERNQWGTVVHVLRKWANAL